MGTEDGGRRYGGRSGAERSAERRTALLEAALRIVAGADWHALRIDALCREAGLSKRYFYEAFSSLDELSTALVEHLVGDLIAATLAGRDRDRTPEGFVRATLEPFVAHLVEDPDRARVLFGSVPGDGAAVRHRDAALHRLTVAAIGVGLEVHEAQPGPGIEVGASFLVGGTVQAVLDRLAHGGARDVDALVEDLGALWQAVVDTTFAGARSARAGDAPG